MSIISHELYIKLWRKAKLVISVSVSKYRDSELLIYLVSDYFSASDVVEEIHLICRELLVKFN
jgi:hypothetical protein